MNIFSSSSEKALAEEAGQEEIGWEIVLEYIKGSVIRSLAEIPQHVWPLTPVGVCG
jgi:hypothetical protein